MSGIYQIPLFKGAPIPEYLKEMESTDPWQFLMDKLKEKKPRIAYLEPTSVIVRLLDTNREVFFVFSFDFLCEFMVNRGILKTLSIQIE